MSNIGSYFEIPVSNLDRAVIFYSRVFGCEFARGEIHGNKMAFFPLIDGSGVSGALAQGDIYRPSLAGSLIYLATGDIDETLGRIVDAGSEVLLPKTEVPGYGWVAEFKDSEGNRVALFQKPGW